MLQRAAGTSLRTNSVLTANASFSPNKLAVEGPRVCVSSSPRIHLRNKGSGSLEARFRQVAEVGRLKPRLTGQLTLRPRSGFSQLSSTIFKSNVCTTFRGHLALRGPGGQRPEHTFHTCTDTFCPSGPWLGGFGGRGRAGRTLTSDLHSRK